MIREIDNLVDKDLYLTIEKNNPSFFSKWKIVRLPVFITPQLAYFVGYLQGDGSIESNKYRVNFSDEYVDQIKRINNLSIKLFGINGRIESTRPILSKKPLYRLEINSIVLNSYLHNIFEINRGVKTDLKIPKLFMENKTIFKWYLIGLFDADGSLPKKPAKVKQLFIDLTFKDKEFIEQLKEALDLFGIRTLKPYCRVAKSPNSDFISKTWELRIRKKDDMVKFLKLIGFFHPSKGVRAEKMLKFLGQ